MKTPNQHHRSEAARFGGFDPVQAPNAFHAISGGQRKAATVPCSPAVVWRWPEERKMQFQAFDDWLDIAMQILHRSSGSFRLMAVYRKAMWWKEGCIWASNEELARDAGHCNLKTVSRDIALHARLGIIVIERGWRKVGTTIIRTRAIKPALPMVLPDGIVVRDVKSLPFDKDTHGPDRKHPDKDTHGPVDMDTHGPNTLDTHEEGARSNDPA